MTTLTASLIVGCFESPSDDGVALFSVQSTEARRPPATRNPTDNSKGPVGPRPEAAAPASCPARMATIESPA